MLNENEFERDQMDDDVPDLAAIRDGLICKLNLVIEKRMYHGLREGDAYLTSTQTVKNLTGAILDLDQALRLRSSP